MLDKQVQKSRQDLCKSINHAEYISTTGLFKRHSSLIFQYIRINKRILGTYLHVRYIYIKLFPPSNKLFGGIL